MVLLAAHFSSSPEAVATIGKRPAPAGPIQFAACKKTLGGSSKRAESSGTMKKR
jgi:hypothetical protein